MRLNVLDDLCRIQESASYRGRRRRLPYLRAENQTENPETPSGTLFLGRPATFPYSTLLEDELECSANYAEANISTVADEARPGTSSEKPLQCTVCADSAEGFHFGAVACAACGAFFRRSVSDQKVYSCLHRKCSVRFDSAKRGGICRYCRFERCLVVGMLPQEVQAKRVRKKEDYRTVPYQKQFPTRRRGAAVVLESLVQARRDIAASRTRFYAPDCANTESGFSVMKRCMATEYQLFTQVLLNIPIFREIIADTERLNNRGDDREEDVKRETDSPSCWTELQTDCKRDMFLMFCVFEMSYATALQGGVQMDRCAMPNGSIVEVSDCSLASFFASDSGLRDPECLARLASPFYSHLVRVCARTLQASHLVEIEAAFLFYLVMHHAVSFSQRAECTEATREKLLLEMHEYYDCGGADTPLKIGTLILNISTLQEARHAFKELIAVVDLSNADWTIQK